MFMRTRSLWVSEDVRLGREAYSIDHQYSEPGDSLKTHDTLHVHASEATLIDISLHIFRSCLPWPSLLSSAGYQKVCDKFDTGRGPLYMAILSDIEQPSIVLWMLWWIALSLPQTLPNRWHALPRTWCQCRQFVPPWPPTCGSLYRGSDWWSHTLPCGAVWPTR